MANTTLVVHNTAEFNAALNKVGATGGTIQLAAGNYSQLILNGSDFKYKVSITSADSSHQAVVNYIKLTSAGNVSFSNITVNNTNSPDSYGVRVNKSHDVSFDNVTVTGTAGSASDGRHNGVLVQWSNHVDVKNSKFTWVADGIDTANSDHINITNNAFDRVSADGVHSAATSQINIINNNFTNFDSMVGFHADPIQFLTQGTKVASSDITIKGNLIYAGSFSAPQSGIFMRDEVGSLAYKNVTISDNTVIGTGWNAILINHAAGALTVTNNLTASWTGTSCGTSNIQNMSGGITLNGTSGAAVKEFGNTAQWYHNDAGATFFNAAQNKIIGSPTDHGLSLIQSWYDSHSAQATNLSTSLLGFLH
jgi:hypothetical protein